MSVSATLLLVVGELPRLKSAKFSLGKVLVTSTVFDLYPPAVITGALSRHAAGDWGDVSELDRDFNEVALCEGGELTSVGGPMGSQFLIITEASRKTTTIAMPVDYGYMG